MKKYFLYICTFIIFSLCSLFTFNLNVEAAHGTTGNWSGNFNISPIAMKAPIVFKDNGSYDEFNTVDSYYMVYETKLPLRVSLDSFTPGYAYSGSITRPIDVSFPSFTGTSYTINLSQITFQNDALPEGLTLNYTIPSTDTYNIQLHFNNYVPTSSNIAFVIYADVQIVVMNNANNNYHSFLLFNAAASGDTAGILKFYSDLSDVPSYEGKTLNSILSFSNLVHNWFNTLNNNISSLFGNLTTNLTTWYNGLISNLNSNFDRLINQDNTQHQQTINGYQGTGTNDASDTFDQGAEELEEAEDDLTNITNSSFNSYTEDAFDTSVITSLGSSLVYVVTWFTNFWNMGGIFTSIMNVGLALSVAFFILRLRGGS